MTETKRPDFKGEQKVVIEGTTYYTDAHEDDCGFDQVIVESEPRWKESELSGDEWRWNHIAKVFRKGRVLAFEGGSDQFEATVRLLPTLQTIRGWRFLSVDECAQPGCAKEPDVMLRIIRQWTKDGTKSSVRDNYVRAFCRDHLHRGDAGLNDNDDNYEKLGMRISGEWVPWTGE